MNKEKAKKSAQTAFIKQISAITATECFGVIGISRRVPLCTDIFAVGARRIDRGVNVTYVTGSEKKFEADIDEVIIDLYVKMEFGVRLKTVADNLIDTVKYYVEKQTDVKVRAINVYVNYVRV